MKALICGLGSIGQRHVRMLRAVIPEGLEIAAYRSRNLQILINDDLTANENVSPAEHFGLKSFADLDGALAWNPDAVFVTNPISMHVSTALRAAMAGAHIFLEKPVGCSLDGIPELLAEVSSRQLVTMVGFQLRFHPMMLQVRDWLQSGEIGAVISGELHFGEWLPGMHPYEDYRESHAARADQGGGVIHCLSHEIDLALWLFGQANRVAAVGGHLSTLQMKGVEDTADLLLACGSEKREFPVHIHLDFLQQPMRRYGRIIGDRGAIEWNYPTHTAVLRNASPSEPVIKRFDDFQRNDMFISEVREFVDAIRTGCETSIPLAAGIETLKVCVAAHRALQSGRTETIA